MCLFVKTPINVLVTVVTTIAESSIKDPSSKSGFPALNRPNESDHRVASECAKKGLRIQRGGVCPKSRR